MANFVKQLRDMGWKVECQHKRVLWAERAIAAGYVESDYTIGNTTENVLKVSGCLRLTRSTRKKYNLNPEFFQQGEEDTRDGRVFTNSNCLMPKGGLTEVTLTSPSGEVFFGQARCNPETCVFRRKVGFHLALSRAIDKVLGESRTERFLTLVLDDPYPENWCLEELVTLGLVQMELQHAGGTVQTAPAPAEGH